MTTTTYTKPSVYELVGEPEEPKEYECICNWCTIRKVTPRNRCFIPLPVKDIVYGNCVSGDRRYRKYGFFCQWSCAISFCFYRSDLQHLVHKVRIEAGRHGIVGIVPMAPDPIAVLTKFNPSIPSTREETELRFQQHIENGVQLVERQFSAISSARVHRIHLEQASGNGVRVIECQEVEHPDLEEQYMTTEKVSSDNPRKEGGLLIPKPKPLESEPDPDPELEEPVKKTKEKPQPKPKPKPKPKKRGRSSKSEKPQVETSIQFKSLF